MQIVDPSGTEPVVQQVVTAPRPATLSGCRIGVLDNGKPNARHVVRVLAAQLVERHGAETPLATAKALASRPAPDEVLAGFRGFDAAIVGVGD